MLPVNGGDANNSDSITGVNNGAAIKTAHVKSNSYHSTSEDVLQSKRSTRRPNVREDGAARLKSEPAANSNSVEAAKRINEEMSKLNATKEHCKCSGTKCLNLFLLLAEGK